MVLSSNGIGSVGGEILADDFAKTPLISLNISNNDIGPIGGHKFGLMLEENYVLNISNDREFIVTSMPTEPVLAEASARIMNEVEPCLFRDILSSQVSDSSPAITNHVLWDHC
ncbi:24764_t:CDS:1 [Dentiscutata erythropus]|uniref:24764_t:CDS:1 n=1 Tax=Dentiscutata erythropus TaxID=1348616 RepID=A0A9N8V6C1_9GLOM|nr:24764_t:CDS:1 [Dentiscutata erythropus]